MRVDHYMALDDARFFDEELSSDAVTLWQLHGIERPGPSDGVVVTVYDDGSPPEIVIWIAGHGRRVSPSDFREPRGVFGASH